MRCIHAAEHLKDCSTESELHWTRESEYDEDEAQGQDEDPDALISMEELLEQAGG